MGRSVVLSSADESLHGPVEYRGVIPVAVLLHSKYRRMQIVRWSMASGFDESALQSMNANVNLVIKCSPKCHSDAEHAVFVARTVFVGFKQTGTGVKGGVETKGSEASFWRCG